MIDYLKKPIFEFKYFQKPALNIIHSFEGFKDIDYSMFVYSKRFVECHSYSIYACIYIMCVYVDVHIFAYIHM